MKKASTLIKPDLRAQYPEISRGRGVFLYDSNNKEYLDGASGAVTVNIGHGVEEIADAMNAQAEKVSFVYRSQFTSRAAEELADKMSGLMEGRKLWSFFVNSGSEATETALKIAVQYWQEQGRPKKNRIISRWMSYHGITMGALSMSGHPLRRERFSSMLETYPAVPAPYCYRCPLHKEKGSCGLACAKELETAILRTGPENTAAFIAEPVIGAAGGAIVPPEGYLQEISRICRKYDILLIADEVMSGMGRTGKWLASEHWETEPDIIAVGKGLSGGYAPIAAALVTEKVMEPIQRGSGSIMAGHTYSANPLSCAVSLAVLNYIESHGLVKRAEQAGGKLKKGLDKLAEKFSFIGDVRGTGLLYGMEFTIDSKTKEPFPAADAITDKIIAASMDHGLIVYPAAAGAEGVQGAAIIIAPPLVITDKELDELLKRLYAAFQQLEDQFIPVFKQRRTVNEKEILE